MNTTIVKRYVERLFARPGEELGRFASFLLFQVDLWRLCVRRLRQNNVMAMSAALSFRTIFAMIPVLVLALLILKSLGALEDSRRSLRNVLDASGFSQIIAVPESDVKADGAPVPLTQPARVINVADRIEEVVAEVNSKLTFNRIGPIGGALLIWTALTLLTTMESSLNRIFGAAGDRGTVRRILLYWSIMTLGPLALSAAGYLGRRVIDTFQSVHGTPWALAAIGWLGPVVVGVFVLSMVYALMPNTQVRFRAALGGAVVAVPLWMLAKWGFALYVRHLVVKGNLYGLLGLLPLFLLWLNVSWSIFLFGAQLAYALANLSRIQMAERVERMAFSASDLLAVAVATAQHYMTGKGPIPTSAIASVVNRSGEMARALADRLAAAGILLAVGDEGATGYLLRKPPDKLNVIDILEAGNRADGTPEAGVYDRGVAAAVATVQARTRASLAGLTLADLLAGTDPT